MDNTIALWRAWAESGEPLILFLEDINHKVIGSIDLNKWYNHMESPVLSETNNSERYYMFIPDLGLGIYFSYFRKVPGQLLK